MYISIHRHVSITHKEKVVHTNAFPIQETARLRKGLTRYLVSRPNPATNHLTDFGQVVSVLWFSSFPTCKLSKIPLQPDNTMGFKQLTTVYNVFLGYSRYSLPPLLSLLR